MTCGPHPNIKAIWLGFQITWHETAWRSRMLFKLSDMRSPPVYSCVLCIMCLGFQTIWHEVTACSLRVYAYDVLHLWYHDLSGPPCDFTSVWYIIWQGFQSICVILTSPWNARELHKIRTSCTSKVCVIQDRMEVCLLSCQTIIQVRPWSAQNYSGSKQNHYNVCLSKRCQGFPIEENFHIFKFQSILHTIKVCSTDEYLPWYMSLMWN